MNREKVAGENFRDGSVEVAFELWIERKTCYYSWVRNALNCAFRENMIQGVRGDFCEAKF